MFGVVRRTLTRDENSTGIADLAAEARTGETKP